MDAAGGICKWFFLLEAVCALFLHVQQVLSRFSAVVFYYLAFDCDDSFQPGRLGVSSIIALSYILRSFHLPCIFLFSIHYRLQPFKKDGRRLPESKSCPNSFERRSRIPDHLYLT